MYPLTESLGPQKLKKLSFNHSSVPMFHPIIPSKIHPGSTGRVKMTHGNSTILKLSTIGQTALSWSMESQKTSKIKPEKGFSGPKFHPNTPSESHFVSTSRVCMYFMGYDRVKHWHKRVNFKGFMCKNLCFTCEGLM